MLIRQIDKEETVDEPKHNPGEPEFGEHDEEAPHNPGEPSFEQGEEDREDDRPSEKEERSGGSE